MYVDLVVCGVLCCAVLYTPPTHAIAAMVRTKSYTNLHVSVVHTYSADILYQSGA